MNSADREAIGRQLKAAQKDLAKGGLKPPLGVSMTETDGTPVGQASLDVQGDWTIRAENTNPVRWPITYTFWDHQAHVYRYSMDQDE